MASPGTSAVVKDSGSVPAPQFWDPVAGAYEYLDGSSVTGELYAEKAPITPLNSGTYAIGAVVKNAAGTFFGCDGQYKGTAAAWIMVFDAAAAPATGTKPIASCAVAPVTSGQGDNNWFIQPAKPRKFATGLYVALSTTGGTFTASTNTDLTFTADYV